MPIKTTRIVYLYTARDYVTIKSGIKREREGKWRGDSDVYEAAVDLRKGGEGNLEEGAVDGICEGVYEDAEKEQFGDLEDYGKDFRLLGERCIGICRLAGS